MEEEKKDLVTGVTENVEETTEQMTEQVVEDVQTDAITPPQEKTFTESQVNEMFEKRLARREAKIRKEYDRRYERLETVLKAGTGKGSVEELTNTFEDFYKEKGIDIPEQPTLSDRQVGFIARGEADEIIEAGFDEVVEEVNRLADIGAENMTPTERVTFQKLAEYRRNEEAKRELAKMGVGDKVLQDNDFIEFSSKLNPSLSIKEKYEIYSKYKPKPNVEPIGSMKGTKSEEGLVKDFYSFEEAQRFTKADFDKNPELFKAVEKSMAKWK